MKRSDRGGSSGEMYALIVAVLTVVLIGLCAPASAWWWDHGLPLSDSPYCNDDPECNCTVWENITVPNGSYKIELISSPSIIPEDYNYTFTVPAYDELIYAGIYEDVWSADDCGPMNFTYNGHHLGLLYFGTKGPGCGRDPCDSNDNVAGNGCGGNGVWWNVTSYTIPGQVNWYYKDDQSYSGCSFDGRDRGAALITWGRIYSNPDTLYIWFNQGMEDINDSSETVTVHIYNVTKSLADEWTLWVCISTGDNADNITFNGHLFQWNAPNHWMDVNSYNVTAYVQDGTNTIVLKSSDDFFHPYWILLVGRKIGERKPDLVVSAIEFQPETPRPNRNFTVNATISNQGTGGTGTAFNVSLWINGSFYDKKGAGPLGAGNSTTVSFTNVSLPEGCHNFRVFVDCDNAITNESNEVNNNESEDYQVGYVIIVRGDNDFEELNTSNPSASAPLPSGCFENKSGTYYIQNLTIENCAGDGILIENTTVPFVIRNCTVHCSHGIIVSNCSSGNIVINGCAVQNCGGDGISVIDSNGVIISNCTVQDCDGKGIRVKNCSYVEIKDNIILNNGGYGIEVYPRTLGVPQYICDCQFINITNNTASGNRYGIELIGCNSTVECNIARNSTSHGIYVYGYDNEIYHNIVENNTDYGIKVHNSSRNYIYWNDFINNSGGGVQAYDNRMNNYWNTSWTVSYTYNGTSYENYTGNYWDNDTCADANGDGICDIAYKIDGATAAYDYYPMKMQWRWWLCGGLCGDVDRNSWVDMGDYRALYDYVGGVGSVNSLGAADVDCNCEVDMGDCRALYDYVGGVGSLHCCTGCACGWLF